MSASEGFSEDDVVLSLSALFSSAASRRVATGIGDDAAVLRAPRGALVWTIDTSVEEVHFRRKWLTLAQVGERSFHAAVSDIAAMGAKPVAALSNLTVPAASDGRVAVGIARGQARAARELGCPVIGGNLSRGSELSVTTTVLGVAARPITRSRARPGDELWLVGDVGLAGAGREWLSRGRSVRGKHVAMCVAAFRTPRALVRAAGLLSGRAHSAIDVSDGLAVDARRLSSASGVHVVLDERALEGCLRTELVRVARVLGLDPLELALYGGEDYALLASGPASKRPRGARIVGRVEKGRGAVLALPGGPARPLGPGFDHFAPRSPAREPPSRRRPRY